MVVRRKRPTLGGGIPRHTAMMGVRQKLTLANDPKSKFSKPVTLPSFETLRKLKDDNAATESENSVSRKQGPRSD